MMRVAFSLLARPLPIVAALALLLAFSGGGNASADSGDREYAWLVGADFLCGLDPSACPAIASAPNGSTIEVTGSGNFSIHSKSASGGGEFTINFPGGDSLSGTWEATNLLGFHSYGSGSAQGLPAELEGGLAILETEASVDGTVVGSGVVQIDCTLGEKIPGAATEGIRVNIRGINFNQEVSGFTVFARQ